MDLFGWLVGNGVQLLQTTSVVLGLFATAHSIRGDSIERKIQNQFTVTSAHRDLWLKFMAEPALHRVVESTPDLRHQPPTVMEKRFVHLLILHLRASFKARKSGMEFDDDAMAADIQQFFRKPIPLLVWEESKRFQDPDFIAFVEGAMAGSTTV